jgi:HD-like signal output (HDOD) protein
MRVRFRFEPPNAPPAVVEASAGSALSDAVERLFSSALYRPPMLPDVALRVLSLSRSSDVSFDAIVSLVESDPMFAMSVLKTASSPLYGGRSPPRTIQQALLRLGLETMTDICMEAAITARVFRAPGHEGTMRVLRDHSVAVAHVARLVSQRSSAQSEAAFTIGLLHEVGLAAGIVALATPALWPHRVDPAQVWTLLASARDQMTERLLRAWKLPTDILANVREPAGTPDAPRAAMLVADAIVIDVGLGLPIDKPDADTLERAREVLDLRLADVQAVMQSSKKLLSKLV